MQPMRAFGHSSASGAEVKNNWRHTSAALMYLYGAGRDNFTFTHEPAVVGWPRVGVQCIRS
jgi:hypothetical protein